jgi:antitoxin component YwqK of YwqJK toxin-antitoxin module
METMNLNQLTLGEAGIYLHGGILFSGFAIETSPDGTLRTQMALMRGVRDGVTRRWHPNGQLESEKSFRNGAARGRYQEWEPDGRLKADSKWNAGACVQERRFDEQERLIAQTDYAPPYYPQPVTYSYQIPGMS